MQYSIGEKSKAKEEVSPRRKQAEDKESTDDDKFRSFSVRI